MLTLDRTTLFYFSLRDRDFKKNHEGLIQDWATKIPRNAKPGGTHSKATPSLTQGSTRSSHAPPSTQSAINAVAVKISNHDDSIKIAEGGLSDVDETKGNERDAAIKSPPKGKQRITSSVSYHSPFVVLTYILYHVTGPSKSRRLATAHHPTAQTAHKAFKQQAAERVARGWHMVQEDHPIYFSLGQYSGKYLGNS